MSLRETLLAKSGRKFLSVIVDGDTFWLQSLTPAESMNVTLSATDISTGKYYPEKLIDMQATQLLYAIVNGDGRPRMFADSELELIKGLQNRTFKKLYAASEEISGNGVDKNEMLGKSELAGDSGPLAESA